MTWTEDNYTKYTSSTYDSYALKTWDAITSVWADKNFMSNFIEFDSDVTPLVDVNWTFDSNTGTGGILIKELKQFGLLTVQEETLGDSSGGEGDFTVD